MRTDSVALTEDKLGSLGIRDSDPETLPVTFFLFLTAWSETGKTGEENGQLHAPTTLTPGKQPPVPTG
jgi:hypothetical protein